MQTVDAATESEWAQHTKSTQEHLIKKRYFSTKKCSSLLARAIGVKQQELELASDIKHAVNAEVVLQE